MEITGLSYCLQYVSHDGRKKSKHNHPHDSNNKYRKKVDIYQINLNFYAIFVAVLDILVRPYELLD